MKILASLLALLAFLACGSLAFADTVEQPLLCVSSMSPFGDVETNCPEAEITYVISTVEPYEPYAFEEDDEVPVAFATAIIEDLEIAVPEIAVPEIAVPEIAVPEIAVPEIAVPEIAVPEIAVPEIAVAAAYMTL